MAGTRAPTGTTPAVTISGKLIRLKAWKPSENGSGGWYAAVIQSGNANVSVSGVHCHAPAVGAMLQLTGAWTESEKWGRQFKASSTVESMPDDREGIVSVLSEIRGIGPAKARRIVDELGSSALQQIAQDPACLQRVQGVSPKLAEEVARNIGGRASSADLEATLAQIGIGPRRRRSLIDEVGEAELKVILRDDPYRLADYNRITFAMVDTWVLATHRMPADSPERGAAALIEGMRRHQVWGHTWSEPKLAAAEVVKMEPGTPIPLEQLRAGARLALAGGRIVEVESCGVRGWQLPHLAKVEEESARTLADWLSNNWEFGDVRNVSDWDKLNDGQKDAVRNAIAYRVSIITGGPGTGKTFVSRAVLQAFKGSLVGVVAPTGKAAKRASQMTGLPASTIHRFLGRVANASRNEAPIPSIMLLDEASMVDASLFYQFVSSLPPNARLIIVGDVDQLPSIQPGNVLGDLIFSGRIPVTRLTTVQRQSADSTVVKNAAIINSGDTQTPLIEASDFKHVIEGDPIKMVQRVQRTVAALAARGFDPISEIQVLAGQKGKAEKGACGTNALNAAIREIINPPSPEKREYKIGGNSLFRIGDKVINNENDYELGVVNGDQGVVVDCDRNESKPEDSFVDVKITVSEDEPKIVRFKGTEQIGNLALAWAMTVHKAQGSEYKCVLMVLHERQLNWSCQRALLYTGITRGKQCVILYSDEKGTGLAISRATKTRLTRLQGLVREHLPAAPAPASVLTPESADDLADAQALVGNLDSEE